ncbi:MAG: magnesium transporter [Ignavibacteria bacterium]|nr:magnesium transporter [Ignavibacteria bacterium]
MEEEKKINNNLQVQDIVQADEELLEDISKLIEFEDKNSLLTIIADLHHADIAEIINHLNVDDAKYLFALLPTELASEVIVELDEILREEILSETEVEKITEIVDELEVDDAADIVQDLPDHVATEVLENIDEEDSEDVKHILSYPEDSAGGLMNTDFLAVNQNATVQDAINEIRANSELVEQIYLLYIIDNEEKLIGTVQLKNLIISDPTVKIKSIVDEDLITVNVLDDQEEVAQIMEKYDLVSIAVLDEHKRMVGRITIDDIVDVIHEEAQEDIERLAGVSTEEASFSSLKISRGRIPWLLFAFIGEMLSAVVLSKYQASIEQIVTAAFFIPIVMAMGGSSGSQAAIIVVRGLAIGSIWTSDLKSRLAKEFGVAILNGVVFSILIFLITYFAWAENPRFSLTLSLSLLVVMINATLIGALIPLLLEKLNVDPALATGPFVTTLNDVIGLLIYFGFLTVIYLQ